VLHATHAAGLVEETPPLTLGQSQVFPQDLQGHVAASVTGRVDGSGSTLAEEADEMEGLGRDQLGEG
jgi:hypothetical protein